MIKIEIIQRTIKEEDESEKEKKYLAVNGIHDEDSYLVEKVKWAHFYNDDVTDILTNYSFKEVGKHFSVFSFYSYQKWWEDYIELEIYCNTYFDHEFPSIKVDLQIREWEHWAKPWSISSLAKQLEFNINELGTETIAYWQEEEDSVLSGFGITYISLDDNLTISEEISKVFAMIEKIIVKTRQDLLNSIDSEAVLTYFQFPEEIKTACKQYLIYFSQFIADIGINIDTELKEELNYTLFKIIPSNKNESLEQIRNVLNIYLSAPADSNFEAQIAKQTNIAAKQWEANIYHLKSQLALANSIIQAKNSAIEMLQLSNYQYKQLLESNTARKAPDKEDIIKGIVAVKTYEGKGFSINLAEILRRLKRTIS